jgi:hypothetical protein
MKLLRRYRRRLENNIEIELKEIGYERLHWINLAHDTEQRRALVNMVMSIPDSIKELKFLNYLSTVKFL